MNVRGKWLLFYCCLCLLHMLEITCIESRSFLCLEWVGHPLPQFNDGKILPFVTANRCSVSCGEASWLELGSSWATVVLAVLEGFPLTSSADMGSLCQQHLGADEGTNVFITTVVRSPYREGRKTNWINCSGDKTVLDQNFLFLGETT